VERRERPPTDGARHTYLAQEGAICRIVDGVIFETVGRRDQAVRPWLPIPAKPAGSAEALKSYRGGLAIVDHLAESDLGNAGRQRDLSLSYSKVGDVLVAQGNLAEALKSYRDGLAIADRLATADPGNADWQRDLAISHGGVAIVLAEQGEAAPALDEFRAGRTIIARLREQSPDNATLPKDLAWFAAEIAKLEQPSAPELEAAQPGQPAR
jgi:tetratricopeptide (TPR) repeat protein